jgi:hypothetical protein
MKMVEAISGMTRTYMGTQDWDNIKHLSKDQIEHLVLNYRGLSALSS